MNHTKKKTAASMAVVIVWIGILCCSTSSVFVRYSTAPALVLAAYRKTFVTLLLAPVVFVRYRGELCRLKRKTVLWCLLSGTFLAIHFLTYFLSVQYTTVAASQVLAGTEVLFVALFMFLTGKERYSKISTMGIAVALAGSVLVAWSKGGTGAEGTLFGNGCAAFCAVMLAAYSLIGTKVRKNCSNTVYTFLVYGTAALVLNLLIPLAGYSYTGYGSVNYLTALGMAIFCSLMGHSVFNWALKYLSPTLVSMCKIFQPVFAATWALLLLAEIPSWNQILGGAVVIGGIFLYTKAKHEGQTPPSAKSFQPSYH